MSEFEILERSYCSGSRTFYLRLRNSDCHPDLPKEGQRVAKMLFHSSITGDFTVYQHRFLNNLLQLFTHTENS